MSDPFQSVRASLAAARASLASVRAAQAQVAHVLAVEEQLTPGTTTWTGDPKAAYAELAGVVSELRKLTRPQQATGVNGKPLKQSGKPVLLPGVEGAIERIEKARSQLSSVWR